MSDFFGCACSSVPSRVGQAWARLAGLPLCRGHADAETRQRFELLEQLLVELGQLEPGPHFSGLPSRWFAGPALRLRCVSGHVHASSDPGKVVAGECPECGDPVTLTFPEDVSDPCQASASDYQDPRNPMRAALLGVLGARG